MTFCGERGGSGADRPLGNSDALPGITPEDAAVIVETCPDGIVVVERNGAIRHANAQTVAMFGYSAGQLAAMTVEDLVPGIVASGHLQLPVDPAGEPRSRPVGSSRQLTARRSDGSGFPVEVGVVSLGCHAEPATVAIIREMTDRLGAEETARALLLSADRERVAAELGDHVVRRLLWAGITLQSVLKLTTGALQQRLAEAVEQLDTAVRDIRAVAFDDPVRLGSLDPEDAPVPGPEGIPLPADALPDVGRASLDDVERAELRERATRSWGEAHRLVKRAAELAAQASAALEKSEARRARHGRPGPADRVEQVLREALANPLPAQERPGIGLVAAQRPIVVGAIHEALHDRLGRVFAAGDGATALGLAIAHQPDVCVLEEGLLGLDGLWAARTIRRYAPRARLLLLAESRQAAESARSEGIAIEAASAPVERLAAAVARLAG